MNTGTAGPGGLELQGVRTWQRTGLTHSLTLHQTLGPGLADSSSTSPIADLLQAAPASPPHWASVWPPAPAERARRVGPRSGGAPPLGSSVHCPPTPGHRRQSGRSGSLQSAPSSRAIPCPHPPAKAIQLPVPTSPRCTGSAKKKQIQEREAWALEFSFPYFSAFLLASGRAICCQGSPLIHRSNRAAIEEELCSHRSRQEVLCPQGCCLRVPVSPLCRGGR